MNFAPFHLHFPELSQKETAVILTNKHAPQEISGNKYILLEYYCFDKTCDCRKVIFAVALKEQPGVMLASIGFGWEEVDFYTKWLFGDKTMAKKMAGAYLEPGGYQSKFSNYFLDTVTEMSQDQEFWNVIKRHYDLFKKQMKALQRNDPCPCGSDRKYKKCCLD